MVTLTDTHRSVPLSWLSLWWPNHMASLGQTQSHFKWKPPSAQKNTSCYVHAQYVLVLSNNMIRFMLGPNTNVNWNPSRHQTPNRSRPHCCSLEPGWLLCSAFTFDSQCSPVEVFGCTLGSLVGAYTLCSVQGVQIMDTCICTMWMSLCSKTCEQTRQMAVTVESGTQPG